MVLCYIQARDVMDRLDQVVGPANWQSRYPIAGDKTICELSIRVDGEWITKSDGAGDTQVEADKGAISDALKRAAVLFGIGRYLYRLGNTYADVDGRKIAKHEYKRLRGLLMDQAWETNPVTGDRLDVNGQPLMSKDDVEQLCNACDAHLDYMRMQGEKGEIPQFVAGALEGFDSFMVVRDILHGTAYQGLGTDQFSILPKTLGIELSNRVSEWLPKDATDF